MAGTKEQNATAKWHERQGGGMTVTFGRGKERDVRVYSGIAEVVVSGGNTYKSHGTSDFVAMAVRDCRALGPDWRILSISTPRTILTDLLGRDAENDSSYEACVVPQADHDVLAFHLVGHSGPSTRARRAAGLR